MFDLANDPFDGKSKAEKNRWIFIGDNRHAFNTFNVDTQYYVWSKPAGCNFVKIMCVGGGEAGTAGSMDASTVTRYGGGGGNSGQIAHGIWPAAIFPDRVYVRAGFGGAPGSSTTLTYGGASTISIVPVAFEETTEAIRRANGTVTLLAALGGNNSTIITPADYYRLGLSGTIQVYPSTLGNFQGEAYGTGSIFLGWDLNVNRNNNTSFLCGGASGSGAINTFTPQNGGGITSNSPIPYRGVSVSGSTGTSAGANGYFVWGPPMFGCGGGGGKGSNAGQGTAGGDGGLGCGGGGGGASASNANGVALGGKGGAGFVIIEVF